MRNIQQDRTKPVKAKGQAVVEYAGALVLSLLIIAPAILTLQNSTAIQVIYTKAMELASTSLTQWIP